MIDNLFNLVFRCSHRRLTRPFLDSAARSYTVCLDCGARFEFDAANLRQGKRLVQRHGPVTERSDSIQHVSH